MIPWTNINNLPKYIFSIKSILLIYNTYLEYDQFNINYIELIRLYIYLYIECSENL